MRAHDGAASAAPSGAGGGLRETHVRMVEAVLGGGGLGEVAELAAEAAGAPVAVVVPRLEAAVASPGARADLNALRRYVNERCRGRPVPVPDGVTAEAPIASGGEVLGGVMLLGAGREDAGEYLQIAALAALTEVAVHGGRAEAERTVRDGFFEELRSRRPPSGDDTVRRGAALGCDLRRGAVALCAELASERPRHVAAS